MGKKKQKPMCKSLQRLIKRKKWDRNIYISYEDLPDNLWRMWMVHTAESVFKELERFVFLPDEWKDQMREALDYKKAHMAGHNKGCLCEFISSGIETLRHMEHRQWCIDHIDLGARRAAFYCMKAISKAIRNVPVNRTEFYQFCKACEISLVSSTHSHKHASYSPFIMPSGSEDHIRWAPFAMHHLNYWAQLWEVAQERAPQLFCEGNAPF